MKQSLYAWTIIGIIVLFGASCTKQQRFTDIDQHTQLQEINIHRFDLQLANLDTNNLQQEVIKLYQDYPDFMTFFVEDLLEVPTQDTATTITLLHDFLSDSLYRTVNLKVVETFADITPIQNKIEKAFARLHYFYPEIKIPELYFFISGFNRQVMFNNQILAMGTDMYLGSDYPLYEEVTYTYMHHSMRPECLPLDIMSVILFRNIRQQNPNPTLLDEMLYRGKIIYLLSVLFQEEDPEEIIGYTKQQWEWCTYFERKIWATILDTKHLFSTDNMTISKYINDAPFTSTVSQDSPGRLGTWTGWRIIESYMNNNPEVTMQELINQQDAQMILSKSNYKP